MFKYASIIIADATYKIMVVPDAYRHLTIPGFQQVVVDNKTGLSDITHDIERGQTMVQFTKKILLLVGRADMLTSTDNIIVVLEWLIQAFKGAQYEGHVIIKGLMPAAYDKRSTCQDFDRIYVQIKNFLKTQPRVHFSNAAQVLMDQCGVIRELLDLKGLTLDGVRELQLALVNVYILMLM